MSPNKFRAAAAKVLSRRPELAARLQAAGFDIASLERLAQQRETVTEAAAAAAGVAGDAVRSAAATAVPLSLAAVAESIIEEVGRPTLFVTGNDFELPADEDLARRLKAARMLLSQRLQSVGRIEVFDGALKWP